MLCIWWGVKGVIYLELFPKNKTVNATRYRDQINKLVTEVINKEFFSGKIYFRHDNARPYKAEIVKDRITKLGWELQPYQSYSPDLAASNYHLFCTLGNDLKGRKFENEEEIKRYLQDFFDSKSKEFYTRGIRDLPRRWVEVIDSNGEYIR